MTLPRLTPVLVLVVAAFALGGCPAKTLVERAIEARSAADIAKDNEIVLAVNGIMADLGTLKASTEIYEQRLLITGLFDDRELYEEFYGRVKAVEGVKKLYWHVMYLSEEEQKAKEDRLLGWPEAMVLDNKVGLALVGTKGIADVNFRVAADALATIYLLGRARSEEEMRKALAVTGDVENVRKIVNYVEVRP